MKFFVSTLGICALAMGPTGCSDGADTTAPAQGSAGATGANQDAADAAPSPDGTVQEEAGADEPAPLSPACAALQPGLNEGFEVDGQPRSFMLDIPADADTAGPWPVVFNWHGLGDTAQNMHLLLASQVDRADFPFIAVTPEDTDHEVQAMGMTVNLDWDVFQVGDGESNPEIRLYDEIMLCLDAKYGVDPQRVHQTGFSIGGIVADMIGVVRGEQIASIATYSGGYFSNPDNIKSLGLLSAVGIDWPSPTHGNAYPQMILFGGNDDVWTPTAGVQVRFDDFARNDRKALSKAGHVVVSVQPRARPHSAATGYAGGSTRGLLPRQPERDSELTLRRRRASAELRVLLRARLGRRRGRVGHLSQTPSRAGGLRSPCRTPPPPVPWQANRWCPP